MYEREMTVLPSDASCRGRMKLRALMDHLQDTASLAVEGLEGGTMQLMARGYAWILTRYEVEILGALPSLDERYVVRTYHDPAHGYGMLRAFDVAGADDRPVAWAKTSWLLLDLAAGRPVKPVVHIPQVLERDVGEIDPAFRDIPTAEGPVLERPCPVRFHDLDANAHVNNAAYFEWMFEATPLDLMSWEPREISASFRKGARWGDELRLEIVEASGGAGRTFVYRVVDASVQGARPMTSMSCTWEEVRP